MLLYVNLLEQLLKTNYCFFVFIKSITIRNNYHVRLYQDICILFYKKTAKN